MCPPKMLEVVMEMEMTDIKYMPNRMDQNAIVLTDLRLDTFRILTRMT